LRKWGSMVVEIVENVENVEKKRGAEEEEKIDV
jgi:hypothetical protein